MNENLRNLLAVVAVSTAAGVTVYTYRDSLVTFADLQAAGLSIDCNPRIAVVTERLGPKLRAKLEDAGATFRPRQQLVRLYRQSYRCPEEDGGYGLIIPGWERFARGPGASADDDDDSTGPQLKRDRACPAVPGFCGNGPKNVTVADDTLDPPGCRRPRAPLTDAGLRDYSTPVDCLRREPDLQEGLAWDGGYKLRWAGFNVFESGELQGADGGLGACEPCECGSDGVFSGEEPYDVL